MNEPRTSKERIQALRKLFDERHNLSRPPHREWRTAHTEELLRIAEDLQRAADEPSAAPSVYNGGPSSMLQVAQTVERREVLSSPAGCDPASSGNGVGAIPTLEPAPVEPAARYTMEQIAHALRRSLYAKTGNLAIEGIIEDLSAALPNGGDHPMRGAEPPAVIPLNAPSAETQARAKALLDAIEERRTRAIASPSDVQRDAERYRWLRKGNDYEMDGPMVVLYESASDNGERPYWIPSADVLDKAVDEARGAVTKSGSEA